MRYHRLVYLILFLWSCKSAVVTSNKTETYSEDLSTLRPDLTEIRKDNEQKDQEQIASVDPYLAEDLSIKEELDSINKIIIQRNSEKKYVDGYTIQIYTGNDDELARAARDSAHLKFPELIPVISYNQPTFKVKVGSYTNRLEAHQIFESLKEEFPYALLIPERIAIKDE